MNTIRPIIAIAFISLAFFSCSNSKESKKAVLLADREAPLGWVYLRMYKDNTFEFESRGLREKDVYNGTYKLNKDTIYFYYTDSIPKAGKTATINRKSVFYIDGSYHESVEIKFNELSTND
jgi:hypothetical protein